MKNDLTKHEEDLKEQYEMLKNSEKEENSRKTYFTIIICVILVLLCILVASFTYYRIYKSSKSEDDLKLNIEEGNTEVNTIDSYTINYDSNGSNYHADGINPGWSSGEVQTFSIENNGSYTISYDILWTDVTNNLEVPDNLVYTITRNGTIVKSNVKLPTGEEYMLQNETIGASEKNTYVLSYQFIETGEDQSYDQGKSFDANFKIVNANFK